MYIYFHEQFSKLHAPMIVLKLENQNFWIMRETLATNCVISHSHTIAGRVLVQPRTTNFYCQQLCYAREPQKFDVTFTYIYEETCALQIVESHVVMVSRGWYCTFYGFVGALAESESAVCCESNLSSDAQSLTRSAFVMTEGVFRVKLVVSFSTRGL